MKIEKEFLYEGKAKQIFQSSEENNIIIYYKDDATAFNGVKKSKISNKGILNNEISSILFEILERNGIKTHYIKKLSDREQLCQKVEIFKLEVIIRNTIAGSMAKRLGVEEGFDLTEPIYELCYKNDTYGDPLINEDHAIALNLATREELAFIKNTTLKINELLKKEFKKENIKLVDFKVEYGKNGNGEILLADEISPDTCRLWDLKTNEKLDKDRFRRDLGNVYESYLEILKRIRTLEAS